jgi:hypothetical protein
MSLKKILPFSIIIAITVSLFFLVSVNAAAHNTKTQKPIKDAGVSGIIKAINGNELTVALLQKPQGQPSGTNKKIKPTGSFNPKPSKDPSNSGMTPPVTGEEISLTLSDTTKIILSTGGPGGSGGPGGKPGSSGQPSSSKPKPGKPSASPSNNDSNIKSYTDTQNPNSDIPNTGSEPQGTQITISDLVVGDMVRAHYKDETTKEIDLLLVMRAPSTTPSQN